MRRRRLQTWQKVALYILVGLLAIGLLLPSFLGILS